MENTTIREPKALSAERGLKMEYKDYKTGETISREQYIANGIERGELLVKEDCGCVVIQDRTADAYIVYCYKHEAAPDLCEVLQRAIRLLELAEASPHKVKWGTRYGCLTPPETIIELKQALSKADGK